METRTIILTLALCFVGVATVFADDANMGTWKLNEAKSTFASGATTNSTVVYEAAGDNVKVTVDGTDKDGNPTHNEWTGKFDGKDYPVTGDPNTDARSYKKIDDRTLELTGKKGGMVVTTGRIVVSADGKTRLAEQLRKRPDSVAIALDLLLDEQKVQRAPLSGYWKLKV